MCLCISASKISGGLKLTDAQKKLVEEDAGQTLAQQENMQISGSQARQMVMQKLLRANEVRLPINAVDCHSLTNCVFSNKKMIQLSHEQLDRQM